MHQRVLTTISESPYHRQIKVRTKKPSLEQARRVLTEQDTKKNISRKLTRYELDAIIGVQTCKGNQSTKFKPKSQFDFGKKLKTEQDSDLESYQKFIIDSIRHRKAPQTTKPQRSLSNVTPKQKSQDRYLSLDSQQPRVQKIHPKILWDMSDEEWTMFGDRFPLQFDKKKLLGRGGFSLVWLGEHKTSKQKFAIKQILSNNTHQSHMKEIWFGCHFFENGQPKQKFQRFLGCRNLVRFIAYDIKPQDTWVFQEVCGDSLGNHLYDLKGELHGNERIYRIFHKSLYNTFRRDLTELKKLIRELAYALDLLQDQRIVHSDLKTENILVKKVKKENALYEITQIKLIDYGSSFPFDDLKQFSMATPEYMCPEILNYILYENNQNYHKGLLKYLSHYKKPWVIDIWSLGCVVLEIISGIPLWMSLKTIATKKGKEFIEYGLFAVKGRIFDKIIERQIEIVNNLDHYLDNNYSGIRVDNELRQLIKDMLSLDPDKRISPKQVIEQLRSPIRENLKTQ